MISILIRITTVAMTASDRNLRRRSALDHRLRLCGLRPPPIVGADPALHLRSGRWGDDNGWHHLVLFARSSRGCS